MSLTLFMHPLASYCWKALIALYECEAPFEPRIIDLSKKAEREELAGVWPLVKFPVLRDDARDLTVPEATIIIEYLAQHYPGKSQLVPSDPDLARATRFSDRFFDNYVHTPMQKIVGDRIRPAGTGDAHGVKEARDVLQQSYALLEKQTRSDAWAMGDGFTMADCAAAPALHYANRVEPLSAKKHPQLVAYLHRLEERPSFARVLTEAKPYFHMFPA